MCLYGVVSLIFIDAKINVRPLNDKMYEVIKSNFLILEYIYQLESLYNQSKKYIMDINGKDFVQLD